MSYPLALCEGEELTLRYVDAREAETPGAVAGCPGSVNGPGAEAGYLCVYRGQSFGSNEVEDLNARFSQFRAPSGESGGVGLDGELIVFRTDEFREATPILELKAAASLAAEGSWAVTTK